MEGELLLSILSSLAESESHSIAENNKWSIQKRYQNGTFKIGYPPYGYDNVDGKMVINKEQADVVRWNFDELLSGKSTRDIAKELNDAGIHTKRGRQSCSAPAGSRSGFSRRSMDVRRSTTQRT